MRRLPIHHKGVDDKKINTLLIQNYALLKNVFIDFTDGFTVISGETGSGKSIMLDAFHYYLERD